MWVRVELLLNVCPTSAKQPMRNGYLLAMLLHGTCHGTEQTTVSSTEQATVSALLVMERG